MSKKITHERIKQIIIEDEPFRQDEMLLYVEQQEKLESSYHNFKWETDEVIEKQEKLLELYRKIYHISPMKNETKESYWARVEYLEQQIKELENDK